MSEIRLIKVLPETIVSLYQRGEITAQAIIEMTPIIWWARRYPELSNRLQGADTEITLNEETCDRCINYSTVHGCCMKQIDQRYIQNPKSHNCQHFEGVNLPYLLAGGEA